MNIDCHIVFDTKYSVPYNLVHELVEVRSNPTTVEIFHKSQWVALHPRARGHGHTVTINEHRRRSHQAHLEWTPSRMVHWAQSIGPHTARLFERILAYKPHPEMGHRSCLGLIRLAGQYSSSRMEAAAERALAQGNLSLPGAAESCADRGGIGGGRRQHRVQLARHDRARKELSPAALTEALSAGG